MTIGDVAAIGGSVRGEARIRVIRAGQSVAMCAMIGLTVGSPGWAQGVDGAVRRAGLPTVTYPTRDPDTAPPAPVPVRPLAVPETPAGPEAGDVLVDGFWGFWDREHRFHRRGEARRGAERGMTERGPASRRVGFPAPGGRAAMPRVVISPTAGRPEEHPARERR